jgi:Cu+-exporting ATPase
MNHGEVIDETRIESAKYACSMHPDVTSDKPGKCSKCGMELVKKNK